MYTVPKNPLQQTSLEDFGVNLHREYVTTGHFPGMRYNSVHQHERSAQLFQSHFREIKLTAFEDSGPLGRTAVSLSVFRRFEATYRI
jgi:hypothetical protein